MRFSWLLAFGNSMHRNHRRSHGSGLNEGSALTPKCYLVWSNISKRGSVDMYILALPRFDQINQFRPGRACELGRCNHPQRHKARRLKGIRSGPLMVCYRCCKPAPIKVGLGQASARARSTYLFSLMWRAGPLAGRGSQGKLRLIELWVRALLLEIATREN